MHSLAHDSGPSPSPAASPVKPVLQSLWQSSRDGSTCQIIGMRLGSDALDDHVYSAPVRSDHIDTDHFGCVICVVIQPEAPPAWKR